MSLQGVSTISGEVALDRPLSGEEWEQVEAGRTDAEAHTPEIVRGSSPESSEPSASAMLSGTWPSSIGESTAGGARPPMLSRTSSRMEELRVVEDELAALTNLRRQVLDAAEFKPSKPKEEAKAKAAAEDLMMGTPSLWAPRNVERAGLYSHVEAVASVTQAARARAKSMTPGGKVEPSPVGEMSLWLDETLVPVSPGSPGYQPSPSKWLANAMARRHSRRGGGAEVVERAESALARARVVGSCRSVSHCINSLALSLASLPRSYALITTEILP